MKIINKYELFNNFFGQNKNRNIFIGIDSSFEPVLQYQFLDLFHSMTVQFILFDSSNILEKEIKKFNDIIYILLVKDNIYINNIKNDSRIFIFKPLHIPTPSTKITNVTNIITFNTKIENFILLNAYVQYIVLNPDLYVNISSIHGFGLYSSKNIQQGDCIFSLSGKVVNEHYINNKNFIGEWNALSNNMYLVRDYRTSYGFINHSRKPNCEINTNTMQIITISDITQNQEIFLDYRKEPLSYDYIDKFGKHYL